MRWPVLALLALTSCYRATGPGDSADAARAERRAEAIEQGVNLPAQFGNRCTADCSGHRAGYLWAMNKMLVDDSQCANQSASFTDGCELAVQDNQAHLDEAARD